MRTFAIVALSLLLVDFLALTAYIFYLHGPVGWIPPLFETPLSILLTVDLLICLTIACVWLIADARRRGKNPWPYIALAYCTGGAGPLLYVITRLADPSTPTSLASPAPAEPALTPDPSARPLTAPGPGTASGTT